MSFIDLMKNDVWSEADIKTRLHAEICSEVSELAETELNRALQGAALGLHTLTLQEREGLAHFKAATDRVAALGLAARADAALLHETMALEGAQRCLGDDKTDAQQRAAAQALIDVASPAALALSLLRKPAEVAA